MKGVALTTVGAFGLIGNILTIVVLSGANRGSFNHLLVALAAVDSFVIAYNVMEKAFVETFCSSEPLWYRAAYPHLLHPLNGVVESMSVFLVVAISAERYRAICLPLSRLRVSPIKYVFIVLAFCLTLEFPRWFEFRLTNADGKSIALLQRESRS